ncbi:MAG: glycosyl transferase [Candidatus Kuenenia stuttgartiensis]|uniref:glycosyltransferase n=1 Tax=Kuenenia stuttgartiensis TaxID=174633 RepID=UPI00146C9513|nr:glycosyltransferase [Candidatus Kuenenia stuttgartiensis]GJQ50989.1 MAG: glycosyl transferase [Candidatus Kuenenia stuttgartiensis]
MNNPLVSVIIPTYNGSRFIKETIQSALDQTYRNLEIIVIDDGSTDNTPEIVKSTNNQKVTYIRQENAGAAMARNLGINISKGEYIAFLDHDDLWLPHKLERQLLLFGKNPMVAMVYSDTFIIDENNFVTGKFSQKTKFFRGMIFKELFLSCFITILTVIIKRSVFIEIGPFLPFKISEEYDLYLKCAAKYSIDYINEPLAKYRIHESNTSKNYETEASDCIKIYNFWKNHEGITEYNIDELISKATAKTYYNAFKNAIRRRGDYKGAIKYFLLFLYSWAKRIAKKG